MSIILNTLERLETDNPARADNLEIAGLSRRADGSKRFPLKAAAIAIVLIVGTSLMVWRGSDQSDGSNGLSPTTAGSQTVAGGKSDHQLSSVPIEDHASDQLQSAEQNSETLTPADETVVPSVQTSSEIVSEADNQPIPVSERTLEADSDKETFAVAKVKPGAIKAPTENSRSTEVVSETANQPTETSGSALQGQTGETTLATANPNPGAVKAPSDNSRSARAVPDRQKQTPKVVPSGNMAQTGALDKTIEKARLALSEGQYQRTLSSLETISPVPEHRADFWLVKGSAHLGLGQLDLAEEAFASAQALAPGNVQIAVQRAILNQEKGDHVSALKILKDAASRHEDVPEIFLNQGYSQQALGAVSEARYSFLVFLRMTEGRSLYAEQKKVVDEWLARLSSDQQ